MEVSGAAEAGTAAAGGAKPLTPEEEGLRRSTDCVYFLASPLTCKKVRRARPPLPVSSTSDCESVWFPGGILGDWSMLFYARGGFGSGIGPGVGFLAWVPGNFAVRTSNFVLVLHACLV